MGWAARANHSAETAKHCHYRKSPKGAQHMAPVQPMTTEDVNTPTPPQPNPSPAPQPSIPPTTPQPATPATPPRPPR